jgi:quercetin dioxygenase-like cupin family protein
MKKLSLAGIFVCILCILAISIGTTGAFTRKSSEKKPHPMLMKLESTNQDYVRLLGGPPETASMRSGLVSLAPGKSVGKHSTENYEEMVIVLHGTGDLQIGGGDTLHLAQGYASYCPSHTVHDVLNTGSDTLRYIYIVASTNLK